MLALRKAVYGILTLLVAIIIAAGSLALVDSVQSDLGTQLVSNTKPQPPIDLGPLGESIAVTGLPIVFNEDTEPTTDALAEGILLTSKQRAIVNFIADVGTQVEVTLHIDNLDDDTDLLALVNILAPDTLLTDVIEGSGATEVRVVGHNQYVMQVDRGDGHNFVVRVTPLTAGIRSFIVEIRAIG